jgi:hypothetical protein
LACLYCGKEIGPFRLLRDKEFCCSAHRQGYSKRLGKALDQLSAQEPPPAPLATFIPYKPFAGNNHTLSQVLTFERHRPEIRLLNSWPLAIVPVSRERAATVPAVHPHALLVDDDFATEPQLWTVDKSLRHLSVDLEPEPWADFEIVEEPDPATAGPAPMDVPAADWLAEPGSLLDAAWDMPPVRLPGADRPVSIGSMALCGAGPSLAAQPVEAFLPPNPPPQMAAFSASTVTPMRLTLRALDWEVAVRPAGIADAPLAQAVESFLPAPAEQQILAWPVAAALPQLQLAAADWLTATNPAEAVEAPAAQAVESFLPAPAEPQILAWPVAAALPQLQLAAADWLTATNPAEVVEAPAAQVVESFLPPLPVPVSFPWPAAAALPQLQLTAADWLVSASPAEMMTAPVAEAVETWLPSLPEPQTDAWPAAATALPRLTVGPAAWVLSVDLAEFVASPAAQVVESWLPAAAEPQIAAWPATATALPKLTLDPTEWVLAAMLAELAIAPAPQAVESLLPAAPEPCAIPSIAACKLPQFELAAIAQEAVQEFVSPVVIANASETFLPSPPACEVVREVMATCGGPLAAATELAMPAPTALIDEPTIRWAGGWLTSAGAEPVASFVKPHVEAALAAGFPVAIPNSGALRQTAAACWQNLAGVAERLPQAIEPPKEETPAIAATYQETGSGPQILQLPNLTLEHTRGTRAAAFQARVPEAIEPGAAELNPGSVVPQLDGAGALRSPASPSVVLRCALPMAQALGGDWMCQQMPAAPIKSLRSLETQPPVLGPRFMVRPIFERVEEASPAPKPVEKTPAFAEIFEISKAARKTTGLGRTGLFSVGKVIAASLIVGIGMWFGAGSVKIGRQMLAINSDMRSNSSSSIDSAASTPAPSFPSPQYPAPKSPSGPIASVRHAIQGRAAVELSDTFRRMESWGANAAALPAGWTRHADGYVRSGQLALFRPAQNFADYRFEFFGQIEKKSMSWAIRAKDSQNYYGMKMTVIEPGLRPVVAMVHYAVVGGKKLQRIETPLSIMIHNNEPYHVAVDVKGNRVVTSIEGQEVDSWTNDALKVGGIGFFSEVGESARLYWMRVSKNQDWLGRVCAYLSNGSGTDTADLWRDDMPHAPGQPALPPSADVTLAAVEESEEFSQISPQRARISKIGRTESCRS